MQHYIPSNELRICCEMELHCKNILKKLSDANKVPSCWSRRTFNMTMSWVITRTHVLERLRAVEMVSHAIVLDALGDTDCSSCRWTAGSSYVGTSKRAVDRNMWTV